MTGNISKDDRIIRIVIGLGFISMTFMGPETLWGWVGIVPLLTAVMGFCPLYKKLGFDTKLAAGEIEPVAEAEVVESSETVEAQPSNREAGAT